YILTSLALVAAGSGGGGITTNSQPYYLRIYSVDATGTNAILLQTYISQNFTFYEGDWLQWAGLSIGLEPNTLYAWSFHRGKTGYELMGSDDNDQYTGGQCALIPPNGGGMTFSTTAGYDAMMDIGVTDITNLFVNAPVLSPSSVVTNGTQVTATATVFGTGAITYQWQTDGGSGGALTNIPGAISASYLINTSNTTNYPLGSYQYDIIIANGSGSATSAVSQLTIDLPTAPATLTDEGGSVLSGLNDISQTTGGGNGDGLNYYDDNGAVSGAYDGQTFTTGTNSAGYYLTSVAVQTGGGGSSDTTTAQGYDLFVFSIRDGVATLMAHYTATNFAFTFGDWLEWSGFEVPLKANTMYAYGFGNERTNTTFQSWAALNSSPTNTDLYPGGQLCLIPPLGGPLTTGATGLSDAVFDAGLLPIGVGPSPYPFSNPIKVSPSTTVAVGAQVTLTETASGAAPLNYQWLADGGSGTLTNIPAYNASNLVVNTTGWQPGRYQYQVIVNNGFGSSTSAVASVTVLYTSATAALADIGGAAPTAGANDIAQLSMASGANSPDGLNYYFDNATPPGQTFTTGSNPGGYVLSTVAISLAGNSGGLSSGGQTYLLRIYSVSGSSATLYAVYSSTPTNFVFANNTDWLRWSGFTLPLNANTVYGYSFGRISTGAGWCNLGNVSGNPYPGGEVGVFPSGSGSITYGSSHNYDGVFDLGLSLAGYPIVSPPAFSPTNVVYAGTPVSISATVSGATSYQWETDGGSGGAMTNISGATSPTLTVDTTPDGGLTIQYALIASNGSGSTTGASAALTVNAGSAPFVVQDIYPTAPNVFAGQSVTFSATFGGTLPITYQWQVNTGGGAVNIAGQTNSTLTLTGVTSADAGTYNVVANNSVGGPTASSASTLTVQALP
ncbi:MAG: beta strand repeat-containing protein, partial [Limisphaerales bacterium]